MHGTERQTDRAREGSPLEREDAMNKQSWFSTPGACISVLPHACLLLPCVSLSGLDPSFLFTRLSECPSPCTSQCPCLQVVSASSLSSSTCPPAFPPPKCLLILADDPLNPLSLSNHYYSCACPKTYANTHAYTRAHMALH